MIALALRRFGNAVAPTAILRSLKENALYSDEMGMYWRDQEGYYWYQAPVERQALLIEAFSENCQRQHICGENEDMAAEAEANAGLEDHNRHG